MEENITIKESIDQLTQDIVYFTNTRSTTVQVSGKLLLEGYCNKYNIIDKNEAISKLVSSVNLNHPGYKGSIYDEYINDNFEGLDDKGYIRDIVERG